MRTILEDYSKNEEITWDPCYITYSLCPITIPTLSSVVHVRHEEKPPFLHILNLPYSISSLLCSCSSSHVIAPSFPENSDVNTCAMANGQLTSLRRSTLGLESEPPNWSDFIPFSMLYTDLCDFLSYYRGEVFAISQI